MKQTAHSVYPTMPLESDRLPVHDVSEEEILDVVKLLETCKRGKAQKRVQPGN
jgi:hypothetical protein